MSLEDLIKHLMTTTEGGRETDDTIAEALGWTRNFHESVDQSTGEINRRPLPEWNVPGGEPRRVPPYTESLQAALDLASDVSPGISIATSWAGDEPSYAKIGESGPVRGATPSLALCAAAMVQLYQNKRRETST